MGRPKKEKCYKRLQIYLLPELVSNLRCNATENKMKISVYIRTILEKLYTDKRKGNNNHGQY